MNKLSTTMTAVSALSLLAHSVGAQVESSTVNQNAKVIEEITVTATRRATSLSEVPIAVNVISGEELKKAGASDVRAVTQLSPSVLFTTTGSETNSTARIRGIGTVGENVGLESSVAIFIDGVYRSRTGVAVGELGDISQIEVLRGPQGTLFGKNASAGLISINTAKPSQEFEADASVSYGNYDSVRLEGGVGGGITQTVSGKFETVMVQRDGFYDDVTSGDDINDRDRLFTRGQLYFEPSQNISLRLIGDYSKREETCCGAVPATNDVSDNTDSITQGTNDDFLDPDFAGTNVNILELVSGLPVEEYYPSLDDPFDREVRLSPGRLPSGEVEDWGVSAELNWEIGVGNLTSITAYRSFESFSTADTDFNFVDYLSTDGERGARQFDLFSQEVRLQGLAFNDKLDWLVGAYYSNEELQQGSTLSFASEYGTFASCFLATAFGFGDFTDPSQPGCLSPTGQAVVSGATLPAVADGLNRLSTISNLGDDGTLYQQDTDSVALFTHNIIHLTNELDLTLGLRYTQDEKDFSADINNTNTVCPEIRDVASGIPIDGIAGGLVTFACLGNNTSELNDLDLRDDRSEEEFTGTLALSWNPTDATLLYGSVSRGYKAGGYNLDRIGLGLSTDVQTEDSVANLEFDPEIVDAFEIGGKYFGSRGHAAVALFYSGFKSYQLNTFDGSRFLVVSINGCDDSLNGADRDGDATTGSCDGDVGYGVVSQGVELEGSFRATPTLNLSGGLTYADTRYEENLVDGTDGSPLSPSLRRLPGNQVSNAPRWVATGSVSWTPQINQDLSALVYLNARWSDDYHTGSALQGQQLQESFTVVNGRVGLIDDKNKWSVELWANNLFDTEYAQVIFSTAFVNSQSAYLADPRTFGLTLTKSF